MACVIIHQTIFMDAIAVPIKIGKRMDVPAICALTVRSLTHHEDTSLRLPRLSRRLRGINGEFANNK